MRTNHNPHSVPALTTGLRLAAIGRRVSASGPLAIVLADLCYGTRQRDHAEVLHFTNAACVAAAGQIS